jgi:hypothetical protein
MAVGARRLHELGPPQKTIQMSKRGRPLRLTVDLLARSSCGMTRPFTNTAMLDRLLVEGRDAQFRRRMESDAKALYALYQYGRLHGSLRLLWRNADDMLPVPWVDHDEERIHGMLHRAHKLGTVLEVVLLPAPAWDDPWARRLRARPEQINEWRIALLGEHLRWIDLREIQAARVIAPRGNSDH